MYSPGRLLRFVDDFLWIVFVHSLPFGAEVIDSFKTLTEAKNGIEQGDYFRPMQKIWICARTSRCSTQYEGKWWCHSLQCFLIQFEKYFESGRESSCLNFPPEPAFIATNTIHNSSYISKMYFELLFQNLKLPVRPEIRCVWELTLAFSPLKRTVSSNLPVSFAIVRIFPRRSQVSALSSCFPVEQ